MKKSFSAAICAFCVVSAAEAFSPRHTIGMVKSQQNVEVRSINENVFRVY